MTLTFGSLFAGIGGLDLGLERAGMRCAWQVENDPYARAVLRKHWPHVECFEDVRSVGAHNAPPVDLICGGFPCQDISVAGKGAGIREGTRSGLWLEFARIIRELRPRYVLVENVPALLARGLGQVLGDLAQSGFDAEWDCISASALGAHHRRDRIFIVAHAMCSGLEGVHNQRRRVYLQSPTRDLRRQWESEPDVGRVAHGVPSRVDRLRCLGNAVVPQVAEHVGNLIRRHAEAA